MFYQNELERIRRELEERKEDLYRELASLPEGELLCTDENGNRRYYQRLAAKGNRKKEHRYGIKKKPDLLNALIRKKYVTNALTAIDADLKAMDLVCNSFEPQDELSVMNDFLSRYPEFQKGIYRQPYNIELWQNEVERIDNYHPEDLKQTDAHGIKRRSKNEVYIASRLDHYELVYRSDCPTGIPGLRWAPDFTILRIPDLKKIYWEHLGMMGDPDYREHNKIKIKDYESAGIVPWDNLILTYDPNGGDMRADIIEAVIQTRLL